MAKMFQRPLIFCDELIDHIAVFKGLGHDLPGVGFHFEVLTEGRVSAKQFQDSEDMIGGVFEQLGRLAMEGDVEMNTPLLKGLSAGGLLQGDVQVAVTGYGSVERSSDDLVKISVLRESLQRF